ncbi:MAG: hypothetical protein ACOC1D_05100, partial [Prolixibacteraceae bacterium]
MIARLESEFKNSHKKFPDLDETELDDSEISKFIIKNNLSYRELITLLIAFIPHTLPDFFNNIINKYLPNGGDFPEFGGTKGKNHRGIL